MREAKKTRLTLCFDGLCEPRNPGGIACYGWRLLDERGETLQEGPGVVARAVVSESTPCTAGNNGVFVLGRLTNATRFVDNR